MSVSPSSQDSSTQASSTAGLRLRLWFACLAGPLLSGAALWWVLGALVRPDRFQPSTLLIGIALGTGAGLLVAGACAFWLDHAIVGQLRGLLVGLNTGRISELRDLPAASGWGELSVLTGRVHALITRHRQLTRATEDLDALRRQLDALRERLERWNRSERWEALPAASGPLAGVAEGLNRGFGRIEEVREQNREAARQIVTGMAQALTDAQESAEQAERGFVEATALLTTVRELSRLAGELTQTIGAPVVSRAEAGVPSERYREQARAAISELVGASAESVESLGRGLMQVQEIAEQVQLLANRATLIAINAVSAGSRTDAESSPELADELKTLAREVRAATERTTRLALAVEGEVATASDRMRATRARLAETLEPAAAAPAAPAAPEAERAPGDSVRLLERVREMIQDAASKGERLSAAGERTSRAAERLARRLAEDAQELEGLAVRLEPVGERAAVAAEAEAPRPGPARVDLKLLGKENLLLDGDDASSAGNGERG